MRSAKSSCRNWQSACGKPPSNYLTAEKRGQMFQRLLIIVCGLLLLVSCAKPPVKDLDGTRQIVAQAYASGASELAPEQYRIASDALHEAELLILAGRHKKANQRLELARRYGSQALSLATQEKKILFEAQQRKLEEERARAEAERLKAEELAKLTEPPAPKKPVSPRPPLRQEPEPKLLNQVEVLDGEDLAMVAARDEVYGDELLWPLIYKANRDQIKDPRQVFPGQTLIVPRDKTQAEQEEAREEARALQLFD